MISSALYVMIHTLKQEVKAGGKSVLYFDMDIFITGE